MEAIFQLILATIFGALIGLERGIKGKEAGLQTYSLVTLGTCLFTIISFELFNVFFEKTGISFDPSRIIMAIAVGIGFIGAGAIIRRGEGIIEGLTAAATIWAVAAIGMAAGAGLYLIAGVTTGIALMILFLPRHIR